MTNLLKIHTIFEKSIISFGKICDYNRNHIFFNIIFFSKKNTSKDEELSMYYLFNKYQKILSLLRDNNLILSEYEFNSIYNNKIIFKSKTADLGMKSLYYALRSYYYYKKSEYNISCIKLIKANECMLYLYKLGFNSAPIFILEQKINLFRVKIAQKERLEAINNAYEICTSVLSSNNFFFFDWSFSEIIKCEEERFSIITYVFDKIIQNTYIVNDFSFLRKEDLLLLINNILCFLNSHENNQFKKILYAFSFIIKEDYNNYFDFLIKYPSILNSKVPSTISYTFYKTILNYIKNIDTNLFKKSIDLILSQKENDSYKFFLERTIKDFNLIN